MLKKLKTSLIVFILFFTTTSLYAADCQVTDPNNVSLVEVAFCMSGQVSLLNEADRDALKADFKKYFGDVSLVQTDVSGTTKKRELRSTKATGSTLSHCQKEGQLAITTLTCELAGNKWESLMQVLKKLCNGDANTTPDKIKDGSDKYFENLQSLSSHYNNLSIPEIKFSEFSADSLLKLYRSFTSDLKCDEFVTTGSETAAPTTDVSPAAFVELWNLQSSTSALDAEKSAKLRYQIYFYDLVVNVAYYDALRVILNYYNLVNSATVTLNDFQKETLEQLKAELVKHSGGANLADIFSVQFRVAQELARLHEAVQERIKNYKQPAYVTR